MCFQLPAFNEGFHWHVEGRGGRPGCFHVSSSITLCPKPASEQYVPGQDGDTLEIEE